MASVARGTWHVRTRYRSIVYRIRKNLATALDRSIFHCVKDGEEEAQRRKKTN